MWGQLQLGKERPSKQVGICTMPTVLTLNIKTVFRDSTVSRFLPLYSDKDVFRGLSLGTNGRVL